MITEALVLAIGVNLQLCLLRYTAPAVQKHVLVTVLL